MYAETENGLNKSSRKFFLLQLEELDKLHVFPRWPERQCQ